MVSGGHRATGSRVRLLAALLLATALAPALAAQAQTPVLQGVQARKTHGAAGTFDLALGSSPANPTTEPRLGPTHSIVFTFDSAVQSGVAVITEGAAIAGSPTYAGN